MDSDAFRWTGSLQQTDFWILAWQAQLYGDCRCRSLCMDQRQHYARELIFYFVSESSPDTNAGKHNRYKKYKNDFIKQEDVK